jgi:hypothetical protein
MFVLETKGSAAARKMSIVMMLLFALVGRGAAWWAALLTLCTHTFGQSQRLKALGYSVFG